MAELPWLRVCGCGRGDFLRGGRNFDAEKTNKVLAERLEKCERAVIPGFYGALPDGTIKTFSRGGSDITGSIVARAVHATCYEKLDGCVGLSHCRSAHH